MKAGMLHYSLEMSVSFYFLKRKAKFKNGEREDENQERLMC